MVEGLVRIRIVVSDGRVCLGIHFVEQFGVTRAAGQEGQCHFYKNERTGFLLAVLGPNHPSHDLNPGFRVRALNRRRRRFFVDRGPTRRYRA